MNRRANTLHVLASLALLACSASEEGTPPGPDTPSPAADGYVAAPQGATRVKLILDAFELAPGAEVYKCQNFQNPFGRDVAIVQSQTSMTAGSHHLLVFRNDTNANGGLEDCSGLEFHQSLHTAQTRTSRTTYPTGVGASHRGVDGIRLNAHYFNTSTEAIRPRIEVVLDAVDRSVVRELAGPIYLNDSTINVPPGKGTAGGTLTIPPEAGSIKLLRVQSHMHRHAVSFGLSVGGGTPLYTTDSWNEPPAQVLSPEPLLTPGTPVTWRCEIQNTTNTTLTFGESADTNEMCTVTGYYYPAPDGMALVGELGLGKVWLSR